MKTFDITINGKTINDVIEALAEAARDIAAGSHSGSNTTENGDYIFDSEGEYEEDEEDEDENEQ